MRMCTQNVVKEWNLCGKQEENSLKATWTEFQVTNITDQKGNKPFVIFFFQINND